MTVPDAPAQTDGAVTSTDSSTSTQPQSIAPTLPPHHSPFVQRSISETLAEEGTGSDSPVMNETLNVIDEHITDLSTPRQSLAPLRARGDDSASEYSSHLDRQSYIGGPESDEENNNIPDEAVVRTWDHVQTAQHLKSIGVDPKHCEIFEEQEISGEVLLDMDQTLIYMKEFDFGVMGKRLKTWHKIRDFQYAVKQQAIPRRMPPRSQSRSIDELSRASNSNYAYDQASPMIEESGDMPQPLQPIQQSKRTSWGGAPSPTPWKSTVIPDTPPRTNTSQSRHSRRHSSIDFGTQPDLELASMSTSSHNKQSSMDKTWSMAGTGSTQATTPTSSVQPVSKNDNLSVPQNLEDSPLEIDRGYFSGNDMDNRKTRNRLSKSHQRQTSLIEAGSKRTSIMKRHNRLSSVGSVAEESGSGYPTAARSSVQSKKGRYRSASAQVTPFVGGVSPAVTNLENDSTSNLGSPVMEKMRMQDRARKLVGLRIASDAVTPSEKSDAAKVPSMDTIRSSELVVSPSGNSTPSAQSLDMDTPDGTDVGSLLTKNSGRPRPKTKQHTSAYTHGLIKVSPAEARKSCDHHGWMKKKSSGLIATWKPRLFILRGRRLSYYYSEDDTEERGIIDISGHKVLAANDDPMVTIHASVTGASKASSTPNIDTFSPTKTPPITGVFYFKLVPPKSGFSRSVQFTKPAVHYFQVDTISQGRKWMGEIMKATITHDLAHFETTNRQKTISLAKARARRERPPALNDTKKVDEDAQKFKDGGLGIELDGTGIDVMPSTNDLLPSGTDLSSGTTSPKALSILGVTPRSSLRRDEKELPAVPADDKENPAPEPISKTMTADSSGSGSLTKRTSKDGKKKRRNSSLTPALAHALPRLF